MTYGRIKDLREDNDKTQAEVAADIGLYTTAVLLRTRRRNGESRHRAETRNANRVERHETD